jgi:CelD/BcsL family acetyltransferase involved in cellulose biosynthesis
MPTRGTTGTVEVFALDEVADADLEAWHSLQNADPQFDSPYFHPRFARAVHESGTPVHVVIERDDDGVRALLPGHGDRSLFRPVGWPGADFQGPIKREGSVVDPLRLLRATGLRAFEFDHLLEIRGFEPWIESRQDSPYVDVTGGLDAYLSRASRSGKDNMSQARRKATKLEQTHGPITFVADNHDPQALERLVALKRSQYAATGAKDYFAVRERLALVHRLLETRADGFAGVLSTLHVGHELFAAHFGIRSRDVLHWWFPVYEPRFAPFAPGWILLRELTAAAPSLGLTRVDLGRGDDEYKRRAKTGETVVCQGIVTGSRTTLARRRVRSAIIDAARASAVVRRLYGIARRRGR